MKKMLALMVALFGMLTFNGCIIDDTLDELNPEPESPFSEIWESFSFKSLTGNADLVITNTSTGNGRLSVETSNYDSRYIAIAVYNSDCETSQKSAPYFDKLAGEFKPEMFGMDFAIVFLDIYKEADADKANWVRTLGNVDAYSNVETSCIGGACKKIFFPFFDNLPSGTIYFVDKENIARTRQGITWNATEDQNEQYQSLRKSFAEYLDLDEITSNPPSVDPWKGNTNDVEL